MAAKKTINPAAEVKADPSTTWIQHDNGNATGKKDYMRFNVFVPEDDKPTYFDFQIYAKSIGLSTSGLIVSLMKQAVNAHRKEIEEAKRKFEAAKKEYNV